MSVNNYASFSGTGGTLLSAYTSDTGVTFTQNTGVGTSNLQLVTGGTVRPSAASSPGAYVGSNTPFSADYTVSVGINLKSVVAGDQTGVLARYSASAHSGYIAIAVSAVNYLLVKEVAGTPTTLATYATPPANGDVLALRVTGSIIQMLVNGVVVGSATDATYTTAGRTGIYVYANAAPSDSTGAQASWLGVMDNNRSATNHVVCDGDSLTWSYHGSRGQGTIAGTSYPGEMLTLLNTVGSGWTADNFGVPSETVATMTTNAPGLLDPICAVNPKFILVMRGLTNDINVAIAGSQNNSQALATIQAAWIAYWQQIKTRYPGVTKIGCTISPITSGSSVIPDPTDWIIIANNFNTWVAANWQTYVDRFLDLRIDSRTANPNDTTYFFTDGCHKIDAGYLSDGQDVANKILGISSVSGAVARLRERSF